MPHPAPCAQPRPVEFDPGDEASWLVLGRTAPDAGFLAGIWQRLPDLPVDAAADDRLARLRERADAMRPWMNALTERQERERQARNFAFTRAQVDNGAGTARECAILRAHDALGLDWRASLHFADGWYAAHAGWRYAPPRHARGAVADLAAYDAGFREGGGNPDDLCDAARRALLVDTALLSAMPSSPVARPRPSQWPQPTDAPRPALWSRRLIVLGGPEAGLSLSGISSVLQARAQIEARASSEDMLVLVATGSGIRHLRHTGDAADSQYVASDVDPLLVRRDLEDILIAARGDDLAIVDQHAAMLPLARNMERLRGSLLTQRAQLAHWLDRGLQPGETRGAGHIRWGKAIHGLTGALGEFTARYAGKREAGHRIEMTTRDGHPATGYVNAAGTPVPCQITISNKRQLKPAIATALRMFGAATRLGT